MSHDLSHHGDAEVGAGLIDLAVNVRLAEPPAWLRARIAASLSDLGSYPRPERARAAVARRHGRDPADVLLTSGAAEAFVLLARSLAPRHAVCLHPSFTEPEAALRAAGHSVTRVLLPPPFALDAALIPDDADLVILGNPTNPTSRLHPAALLETLARPGRTLVVDEAFADAVPGEPESLAHRSDVPGLIVIRSLTKTWGLAGLRVGYLLADPATVRRLARAQPLWSVSSPALVALEACSGPAVVAAAQAAAATGARARDEFSEALAAHPELTVTPAAAGPFLLVHGPRTLRQGLRDRGIAVRRGDTFPGLDEHWVRIATPPRADQPRILKAIGEALEGNPAAPLAVQQQDMHDGSVTLVGAGPGAVDLLTLRGWRALHDAEVVVTDRLVSADLLAGLHPGVEIIEVGKAPGRHAAKQEEINALLVAHGTAGKNVVRLKGGDPFVFGRGGEELLACAEAGLETIVIPGLSTATAVPTLAGIPVTHRGLAQSFTVVSGHLPPGHEASTVDWDALARGGETVVLLMGVATLPAIAQALINGGRDKLTPVVSIENGGSPRQRVIASDLASITDDIAAAELRNPAVTVIGEAAAALARR